MYRKKLYFKQMLAIKYTKSFDKCLKKLKKYSNEYSTLDKILDFLHNIETEEDLLHNPVALMYGFERLKYQLNEFYSFNLSKAGGVIRLIIELKNKTIYLDFISFNHYKDFNKEKVIYYDE